MKYSVHCGTACSCRGWEERVAFMEFGCPWKGVCSPSCSCGVCRELVGKGWLYEAPMSVFSAWWGLQRLAFVEATVTTLWERLTVGPRWGPLGMLLFKEVGCQWQGGLLRMPITHFLGGRLLITSWGCVKGERHPKFEYLYISSQLGSS